MERIWIADEHIVDETGARPYLEPYLLPGAHSAIIVLPGGGYEMKADHEGTPVAKWLNEQGISAFVLQYRLTPKHRRTPLADGQAAIRHVRAYATQYGLRPDRIGILGFSAGGHLAAMTGTVFTEQAVILPDGSTETVSSRPDLMVLCYPVITMEGYGHEGSKRALLGADASPELVMAHSAERQATAATPPAFLWHTADDGAVPVQNSLRMALALEQHGIPFELHVYEHGGHGAGLAIGHPAMGSWTERCADWLHRQGW
ncbi:alpha/beta hydrolase [Paenibacillus campi]|uniref:alpha/beta hydrolase n=1 Tax=Paenibacillus campi TaxID=3106031 RepID=UPI002AFDE42C|nr:MULTISPECIES: alpha/beta hydrolase [unclassified Paenibacillus]